MAVAAQAGGNAGLTAGPPVIGAEPGGVGDILLDLVPRLGLGGFYGYFGLHTITGVIARVTAADWPGLGVTSVVDLAPAIGKALFMLVIAVVALFRRRRIATTGGLYGKVVAFLGTFLLLLIGGLPPKPVLSFDLSLASAILLLVGSVLGAAVACWLGRSFSIMPEARRLVVAGPYRLVRHPLYVVEEIAIIGVLIQFPPVWAIGLLIVHLALQLERMRLEERVLSQTFPEYAAYAARTARLIPGIY